MQGADGKKLLKQGPDMPSYRGLKIIKSKSFSLDEGSQPRDLLRRRVRTAEFYLVPNLQTVQYVHLYDEASDNWSPLSVGDILSNALKHPSIGEGLQELEQGGEEGQIARSALLLRPNIEHYMLALIIGRGGLEHLGATFWGQTEMSVFDDGQHGVWGMTYKCKALNLFSCALFCAWLVCCWHVFAVQACGMQCSHCCAYVYRPRTRNRDQRAQHAPRMGCGV